MDFEDMRKVWKSQRPESQSTPNAAILLRQLQHEQREFRETIFWRDLREVAVGLLLALFFFYQARLYSDWSDALISFAVIGVAAFLLLDRVAQRSKSPRLSTSLQSYIEASVLEIENQIWLLKNVLWWYLLPIAIPLFTYLVVDAWRIGRTDFLAAIHLGISILVIVVLYWGIYLTNQLAVRRNLEPRRLYLVKLKEGLES